MSIVIVEMTDTDYGDAFALWQATEGIGLSLADSPQAIAAFLARNPGLSLVARDGERLAGTCLCGQDGRRGYLHHLAVAGAYRGRGLGRRLVESCLQRLAECGIDKCHAFLRADNGSGEAFWRAVGWTERTDIKMISKQTRGAAQ